MCCGGRGGGLVWTSVWFGIEICGVYSYWFCEKTDALLILITVLINLFRTIKSY